VHTFEHDKVFISLEVAGLTLVDDKTGCFWIADLFLREVDFEDCSPECLAIDRPLLLA